MLCEPPGHRTVLWFLVSSTHSQFSKFLRHWCLCQKNRTYLCSQNGSRPSSMPHLSAVVWHPDAWGGSLTPAHPVGGRGAPGPTRTLLPLLPEPEHLPRTLPLFIASESFLRLLPPTAMPQPALQGGVYPGALPAPLPAPSLGGGSRHGRAPTDLASLFVLRGSW